MLNKFNPVKPGKERILIIATLLCMFFVLHNRWVVPRISFDQMRQLVALENIVSGNGVSFQFAGVNNEPVKLDNSFPMGYYILMTIPQLMVKNAVLIHRIFELLGLILLMYQLYLFGNWIEKKYELRHFKWYPLLFSLIQLNPWRAMGFTDIWSLLFFIAAIRLVVTGRVHSVFILLIVGALAYMTVSMRYAYYPLAFIPAILVILKYGSRQIRGYIPLITLLILIGMTSLFNHFYFSDMDHLEAHFDSGRWFFAHIKQMDPVGINAFFSDHVIFGALGLDRWGANTNWTLKYAFLTLSVALLAYLFALSWNVFKISFRKLLSSSNIFGLSIWLSVLTTIGFISALSIYFPSNRDEYLYTWQLISRYYAPAYILLQLLIIFLLFKLDNRIHKMFLRGIVYCSIIFQLSYAASFLYRFSPDDAWGNYVQFYGREEMPSVMENYKNLIKDPDMKIDISISQMKYEYLSFYYLTGPERFAAYMAAHCPDCSGIPETKKK